MYHASFRTAENQILETLVAWICEMPLGGSALPSKGLPDQLRNKKSKPTQAQSCVTTQEPPLAYTAIRIVRGDEAKARDLWGSAGKEHISQRGNKP